MYIVECRIFGRWVYWSSHSTLKEAQEVARECVCEGLKNVRIVHPNNTVIDYCGE